jgi:hypothetical protein
MRNPAVTPVSAIFKEPGGAGGKSRGAWLGAAHHVPLLSQRSSPWTFTRGK